MTPGASACPPLRWRLSCSRLFSKLATPQPPLSGSATCCIRGCLPNSWRQCKTYSSRQCATGCGVAVLRRPRRPPYNPTVAAPPRDYCPTNVQERILRPRSNFTAAGAPILRRCGKTGWRCGPPVEMLTSSRNWTNRRCAQIRPHHTSQRRHRTHRVVRPHAEDTPRLYALRLRGRVFKRSPVLFVVTPLSAKTICPSGNCSPMAFWSSGKKTEAQHSTAALLVHGLQLSCARCVPILRWWDSMPVILMGYF